MLLLQLLHGVLQCTHELQIPDNISHGVNSSVYYYTIDYYSIGTIPCDSVNVSVSSCMEGKCKNEFLFSKNSSCLDSESISINVIVFATNILGAGNPSKPNTGN